MMTIRTCKYNQMKAISVSKTKTFKKRKTQCTKAKMTSAPQV